LAGRLELLPLLLVALWLQVEVVAAEEMAAAAVALAALEPLVI
jgi:hypothetical protein